VINDMVMAAKMALREIERFIQLERRLAGKSVTVYDLSGLFTRPEQ
jgi:hypothetical protein